MAEIDRKNVFVVGAGASKEFGLPTGAELLEKIAELAKIGFRSGSDFYGDGEVASAFQQLSREKYRHSNINEFVQRARFIGKNMPIAPSIDNFLHTHSRDEILIDVGKILISKALLDAERNSTLFVDSSSGENEINFGGRGRGGVSSPRWSWLGEFFKLLVAQRDYDQFRQALSNIIFISFNYDRCIKQFLSRAAVQYFALSSDERQSVSEHINVIHPFGSLGDLAFDSGKGCRFGAEGTGSRLIETSRGIRVFTEGIDDKSLMSKIEGAFIEGEVVMFLGFGFHSLNMQILLRGHPFCAQRVVGSAKGLSEESVSLISQELSEGFLGESSSEVDRHRVALSDLTCSELFQKHAKFMEGITIV